MDLHFASPFNCVYSAAELAKDPAYPAKKIMGTGAFGGPWAANRD